MRIGRLAAGYGLGMVAALEIVGALRIYRQSSRLIRVNRRLWRQTERILYGATLKRSEHE